MLTVKGQVIETKGLSQEELLAIFIDLERRGLLDADSTAYETENEVEMARRLGTI